ncbi:MAG: hypothetical protein ACM3SU_13955 [Acidobacteriota bacterium]
MAPLLLAVAGALPGTVLTIRADRMRVVFVMKNGTVYRNAVPPR